MKRKGLGALAGFKHMSATLFTSGDFILAEAKRPEKHTARVNITDTEHSSYSSVSGSVPGFVVRSKPQNAKGWEEYVLRQPKVCRHDWCHDEQEMT